MQAGYYFIAFVGRSPHGVDSNSSASFVFDIAVFSLPRGENGSFGDNANSGSASIYNPEFSTNISFS